MRRSRRTKKSTVIDLVNDDDDKPKPDVTVVDDDKPEKSDESSRSEKKRKWVENCRDGLVYVGREASNKAIVHKTNIEQLDKPKWLSDCIIEFYYRWLEKHQQPEILEGAPRIYIFDTLFWKKLTNGTTSNQRINYKVVQKKKNKVDIFSYDYIIVPINEEYLN